MIENPISIREALSAPFKKIGRALTGKIESITTKADKDLDASLKSTDAKKAPPPAKPAGGMAAGGLLMGGGVAVAALGSSLAYITKTLAGMWWYEVLGGVGIAILVVLIPLAILAFVRLRRRDLSAILEGAGWAINARMRLSRKQARFFTRRPGYPLIAKGIHRRLKWVIIAIIVVVILAVTGIIAIF